MRVVRNRGAPGKTLDRSSVSVETPGVFATERLGKKQSVTPEGYLLCEDVPIARLGSMLYSPMDGLPIEAGPDGLIRITRDEDVLFADECLRSFIGKPITDEHPESGDVNPATWSQLAKGFILQAYRGEGENSDCIVADLLITDAALIADVRAAQGRREVSAGYDAEYVQTSPGHGAQVNIIGNHLALVERGRCGPRCAIGDHATTKAGTHMTTATAHKPATRPPRRVRIGDRIRQLFKDAAEDIAEGLENDGTDGDESDPSGGSNASPGGAPTPPKPAPGGDSGDAQHIHIHMHGPNGDLGNGSPEDPPGPDGTEDGAANAPPGDGTDGGTAGSGEEPTPPASDMQGGADMNARVAALETGMNQMLAAIKQLMGQGQAQPPAAPPQAGDDAPTNDGVPDGDDVLPDETGSATTMDSMALETSFNTVKADVEVLVPGYAFPAFRADQPRAKTLDSMCTHRRRALDFAYITQDGKQLIDTLRGTTKTLDTSTLDCKEVAMLFRAAAGAKRAVNNRATVGDTALPIPDQPAAPKTATQTLTTMNKSAAQFWSTRKPKLD